MRKVALVIPKFSRMRLLVRRLKDILLPAASRKDARAGYGTFHIVFAEICANVQSYGSRQTIQTWCSKSDSKDRAFVIRYDNQVS